MFGQFTNLMTEVDYVPYLHMLPSLSGVELHANYDGSYAQLLGPHPLSLSPLSRLMLQSLHVFNYDPGLPCNLQHMDQLSTLRALSLTSAMPVSGLPPALTALALCADYLRENTPLPADAVSSVLSTAASTLHLQTLVLSAP